MREYAGTVTAVSGLLVMGDALRLQGRENLEEAARAAATRGDGAGSFITEDGVAAEAAYLDAKYDVFVIRDYDGRITSIELVLNEDDDSGS